MHGYNSCKESFIYQIDYFSKYFRVIAIDITGFGKSKSLPNAYNLDDYIKDIKLVLASLDIQKCNIIAHSFGGRIAIKLGANTNLINKLVLTGSAGLKPKRSLKYYFKIYYYKLIKKFLTTSQKSKFGSEEYKALSGIEKQTYYNIVNEYLDSYLSKIKCRTLVIFGENDIETPIYMAKKLTKKVKNSSIHIIKNAGHFCFNDNYFEFNLIVNEFFRG